MNFHSAPQCGTELIQCVTLQFQDWCRAALLRYKRCTENTILCVNSGLSGITTVIPRVIADHAYAKFWEANKMYYWSFANDK